jgi:hypothetical protein
MNKPKAPASAWAFLCPMFASQGLSDQTAFTLVRFRHPATVVYAASLA